METDKKTFLRWTQISKTFPTNKYGFKFHLKRVGDFIVTHPMSNEERAKFKYAAYAYAWAKKWRVRFKSKRIGLDSYECTVTLVSKTRYREYE